MTFGELCKGLTPEEVKKINFRDRAFRRFCFWPPNIFCLLAAFLKETGAYTFIVCPPDGHSLDREHEEKTYRLGEVWFNYFSKESRYENFLSIKKKHHFSQFAPKSIENLIKRVFSEESTKFKLDDFSNSWELNQEATKIEITPEELEVFNEKRWSFLSDIFTLFACCDYASMGIEDDAIPVFSAISAVQIRDTKNFSFSEVRKQKAIVQAKQRVPQVGLGLNGLSHYLAYVDSEVDVAHYPSFKNTPIDNLNDIKVLLLPWPLKIPKANFGKSVLAENKKSVCVPGFDYFDYNNTLGVDSNDVIRMIEASGDVDFLIFPEATMSKANYLDVLQALKDKENSNPGKFIAPKFIICGVYETKNNSWSRNYVYFSTKTSIDGSDNGIEWEHIEQQKHHRWCLDSSQIRTYGIQSQLSCNNIWWEGIEVGNRELKIINIDKKFSLAPLICEDLARQDPVSEVVRSVAPNLVVALLLDGPQLTSRWSSRYASVLTDDPGCSVLSMTAMGMIERSNLATGHRSKVIALWKDSVNGYIEISLPEKTEGVIMSLNCEQTEEYTFDGRSDFGAAVNLVYKEHFAIVDD